MLASRYAFALLNRSACIASRVFSVSSSDFAVAALGPVKLDTLATSDPKTILDAVQKNLQATIK